MISPRSTLSCKEADERADEGHAARPELLPGRSGQSEGLASMLGVTGHKRQS